MTIGTIGTIGTITNTLTPTFLIPLSYAHMLHTPTALNAHADLYQAQCLCYNPFL